MNMQFSFTLLSKYRTQLMGIAMLWVIWLHSPLFTGIPVIDIIKKYGYGGVDIFLMLSGIGNFFSLQKSPNILQFYKRKLLRILPIYILIVTLYSLYIIIAKDGHLSLLFYNITTLTLWTSRGVMFVEGFDWYIPCLMLFYLVTPWYIKAFNKKPIISICLISLVGFILSLLIAHTELTCFLIMTTRIPIYFIGILIGYIIKKNIILNLRHILLLSLSLIIGVIILVVADTLIGDFYLWSYGLWWYPFILITPPLSMALAWVLSKYKNYKFPFLSFVGKYSLPIYLLHRLIPDLFKDLNIISSGHVISFISLCLTFIISYFLQNTITKYTNKFIQ